MTDKPTLYMDLDSTLHDTREIYEEAQLQVFGKVMPYEDITHWYASRDFFGDGFYEFYNVALHPDWIHKRKLYKGAAEAVGNLAADFNIHIITHNKYPDLVEEPYRDWIESVLPVPVEFTVYEAHNSKIDTMNEDPTAFGIVEDKPDTIIEAVEAGYRTYIYAHPWNMKERKQYPHVFSFTDWRDAAFQIREDLTNEREGVIVYG